MLKSNIQDCVREFNIDIDDSSSPDYDEIIARILNNIDIAKESLTYKLGTSNTFAL